MHLQERHLNSCKILCHLTCTVLPLFPRSAPVKGARAFFLSLTISSVSVRFAVLCVSHSLSVCFPVTPVC